MRHSIRTRSLLAAALGLALATSPACLMVGRATTPRDTAEEREADRSRPHGIAASVTERVDFDAEGWSQEFSVAEPELAFEISAVRTTSDVVDLWLIEPDGRLRLLVPASLLDESLPTLVVPPGARLKAKRVIGKAPSTDLLLSGRLVRR